MESQIAEELLALARNGASGALVIDGDPGGTIYLDDGCVTFAESAGAPDLGARLTGSGRLADWQWQVAVRTAQSEGRGVGALADQGLISADELQAITRSAVLDAIVSLTVPMPGEPYSVRTWLAPRDRHWAGTPLRLDIESVREEVAQAGPGRPACACQPCSGPC